MSEGGSDLLVRVTSQYGASQRQPQVNLVVGDRVWTFDAAKAKEIGAMLVEAATAAEADAFVFEWGRDLAKGDEGIAMHLLSEFRQWREKRQ